MNRSKIERWILSQNHCKNPNLVFGLTVICVVIIMTLVLFCIAYIK